MVTRVHKWGNGQGVRPANQVLEDAHNGDRLVSVVSHPEPWEVARDRLVEGDHAILDEQHDRGSHVHLADGADGTSCWKGV